MSDFFKTCFNMWGRVSLIDTLRVRYRCTIPAPTNIILVSMPLLQNILFLFGSQLQYCKHFSSLCESLYNGMQNIKMSLFQNRPPLWSSGQSSWLQIRRPGFDSRHYQKKKVMGLERSPLSLVSTTEELLDRKVAAPV
jgi:hypothetical protein